MFIGAVLKPRIAAPMNPLAPPMIAPSSMKEPSRAVAVMRWNGPNEMRRTSPMSPPSICQPPPNVAARPSVSAFCAAAGVDKTRATRDIVTMDRRTFVLLTGAGAAGLLRPPAPPRGRPPRAVAKLRFELDEQRRWSLWYQGDGPPVPLVAAAELGAWIGDHLVTFAELEDITVGR